MDFFRYVPYAITVFISDRRGRERREKEGRKLLLHCRAAGGNILTDTSRRAVCLR